MILLAIETATEACSAALYQDGAVLERHEVAPREHNRLILPMLESLLAEAGLALGRVDAVAFGRGPGSFTGVRIAAGVAQGIAFALDLPVAPVSTLAALADEAIAETGCEYAFPCIDARMAEVYFAVYRRDAEGCPELLGQERVLAPGRVDFSSAAGAGAGTGSGWATYRSCLSGLAGGRLDSVLSGRFPRAAAVARLGARIHARGDSVPPEQALPVYLRDDVAKKPKP
ncbi:tRNA (adenosine(37)-N6)-threonylcarbamoyltransferase complex dimerization subunit type 1 TsaB [Methylococcus capsulatus]|jgi:tRNA threonylcarbamoyladenosine biosynthesis protein TsaB|nr:tRNA (adenosine(37)-N6)-threonylcarbamoyltransferase complex dimerization subunit type 1 TsaB [Methylococcus capsulatus]QXP87197.1 tRNA (adenosine(37)-N6)-threonylcarbamoyltransferase complex dimerization subunit type 1 TsaB [Methylococcus capsulatus]QXP91454.1 tRNA (adenosine(37)-N6)-threonylcarbamoyltransferase complex dimerization subunit type 1 TsaB [Methylococcus capsulatus]QXP93123.1 tRNA (adenosine(37)-N6)-threonylcarbamoyltransferase complex dimerization subunit type 1 TsaB [Methyloco